MTTPSPEAGGESSPASSFATALIAEFLRLGVRDLVLSPGSRSQALGIAASRFEAAGLLRLHVRIDERSAGFLALGLAIESRTPVVIVTTSGTAVANLHPAVLEAAHSGVPLVVLSADRPEELREIRANQTTHQSGIFAGVAPHSWDVPAPTGAEGDLPARLAREVLEGITGPRHVNLAFREPLSGVVDLPDVVPGSWFPAESPVVPTPIAPGPATIVIAGSRAGEVAEDTARRLGAPLIAEIASGAHFGPNLVLAYRELLTTEGFGDRIERVVVFGHPTLSREVPALIERADIETIVVRSPGVDDYNPGRRVSAFADAVTVVDDPEVVEASRSWVGRWVAASRELLAVEEPSAAVLSDDYLERARFARGQLGKLRAPVTRRALAEAVWSATWPHDRLVVGASRLVRELDKVAPGKKIRVHANRGLAGIDGTIATASGIALASQRDDAAPGITRVLLGDLSFLHDVGSLLGGAGEAWPRIQLVIGNDHGGTIFDGLEVARTTDATLVDRVLLTPHAVEIKALADAYGWRLSSRGEPRRARRSPDGIRRPGHRRSAFGASMNDFVKLLRAGKGFDLSAVDPSSTPGFTGGKAEGIKALSARDKELAERQELLFANSTSGDRRRVLLVLQAMDTAGKGGVVKHVIGSVDPQGIHLAAFKRPTEEEERHDFLWRIRKQVPPVGKVGVFDRSHYESVLIHRVRHLSTPEEVEARYGEIVEFERELVADEIAIVKVMLHISFEEQGRRLMARLDRPDKHWKFNPGDIDERELWPAYMEAYEIAITRTSTDSAPWYVVPADRKWYARLAVQHLLLDALTAFDQDWPVADFDVEEQKARLQATQSVTPAG